MKIMMRILMVTVAAFIVSCGGGRPAGAVDFKDFDELTAHVQAKEFEIDHLWAMPLGSSMIDLTNNPNYLRVRGENVDVFLPYFGVRQAGGSYGSGEAGIRYDGPAKNLTIVEDKEKRRIEIRFEGRQDTENLSFYIIIFQDGKANTSVTSSQRQAISYRGHLLSRIRE